MTAPEVPPLERATDTDATHAPEVGGNRGVAAASETSAGVEDANPHTELVSGAREAASGTHYFASHEVDTRAAPQGAIHTDAPEGTEDYAGYLVLRLLISERGDVDQVDVLISEPEGVFDEAAKESFGRASFYPAMRRGFPVKSQMVVELKIEPDFGALLSQSANVRQLLDRPRKEDHPRKD